MPDPEPEAATPTTPSDTNGAGPPAPRREMPPTAAPAPIESYDDAKQAVLAVSKWIDGRRQSLGRDADAACADVRMAVAFVRRSLADVDADVRSSLLATEAYTAAFGRMGQAADDVHRALRAVARERPNDILVSRLTEATDRLREELITVITEFQAVLGPMIVKDRNEQRRTKRIAVRDKVADLHVDLDSRRLARETQDEQLRVLDKTKLAAGTAGAGKIGDHYEELAKREARTADVLRVVVGVLLLVVAAGALGLPVWLGDATLVQELVRLSATIPVAVLATYCARESTKHRATADWARKLAMAMHTLPAYSERLDERLDDNKAQALWQALGMQVFGAPSDTAAPAHDGLVDDTLSVLDRLLERVEKVLRLVRDAVNRRGDDT